VPPSSRQQRGRLEQAQLAALAPPPPPPPPPPPSPPLVPTPDRDTFQTEPNQFHVFHKFPDRPTLNPEDHQTLAALCDAPSFSDPHTEHEPILSGQPNTTIPNPECPTDPNAEWHPFSSPTAALMTIWHYTGSTIKSTSETNRLIREFIQHDLFKADEVSSFDIISESHRVDQYLQDCAKSYPHADGWTNSSVKICVPCEKKHFGSETEAPKFEITGVHHRDILKIIIAAFHDSSVRHFHLTPFSEFWKPFDDDDTYSEQLYSEIYTSEAMQEAHEEIQGFPREPGELERVVAPLMVWSDSTHLAQFGTASVWPFYLALGNQSKYVRSKPTSGAFHHLAYIPSVCHDINFVF
jgi:Plavaka transposase